MPSPINDPLWALLLSTNDCYPGCGCEDDHFQMTPERIANWIKGNGLSTAKVASSMLKVLRQSTTLDTEAFGSQINRYWYTPEEPFVVLDEWQIAIDNAISSCED